MLVTLGNHGAGFTHDGAQFFGTEIIRRGVVDVHPHQAQQGVGNGVYKPDKRLQQPLNRQQCARGRKGNLFRRDGGEGFWRQLGKDQHHQSKQDGVNKDGEIGVIRPQALADDGCQSGGSKVDQVITGKDGTNQTIGLFQQFGGTQCPLMLTFGQMA